MPVLSILRQIQRQVRGLRELLHEGDLNGSGLLAAVGSWLGAKVQPRSQGDKVTVNDPVPAGPSSRDGSSLC